MNATSAPTTGARLKGSKTLPVTVMTGGTVPTAGAPLASAGWAKRSAAAMLMMAAMMLTEREAPCGRMRATVIVLLYDEATYRYYRQSRQDQRLQRRSWPELGC